MRWRRRVGGSQRPQWIHHTHPHADADACDHYLSGISLTGRLGPNWFQVVNGQMLRCGGLGVPEEGPTCGLTQLNQYLLDVTGPGLYRACAGEGSSGTCGGCILEEDVFGTVHDSPAGLCKGDPGD